MNGKFVNKNCGLFMDASNTGYILEKARYEDISIYDKDVDINGNFYVYAGDKDLLLTFYKGFFYVISNGLIFKTVSNSPFIAETLYVSGAKIKISHLDPDLKIYKDDVETWEEYVKENWNATGKEKFYELKNGKQKYKDFIRRVKRRATNRAIAKERTQRWLAQWEHNGNKYEVIFGYGVDPCGDVWNDIKYDSYGFTEKEIVIIDGWFIE